MAFGDTFGGRRIVPSRAAWPLLLFVGVAASLLVVTWPHIAAMSYEWGDFASNSLLVQRAKDLHLLHGNYSRVGFYHPGPAILYVLAGGEVLFHDVLGITSPIGGQRVAVILYTSAWVSLAAAMLARLFGGVSSGLIGAAVLAGVTLYDLPEAFTNLWFPDLYYFPFAAFAVALGLAVRGDARTLPVLALSMGVLVNGHVSFAAITVVMIAFGLAANAVLGRAGAIAPDERWWTSAFLARNGRRIAGSVALGALFLIPLAIDTVVHYPGQIPAYLAYKSGHADNGLRESVGFALSYLGPWPAPAAVGAAVLILALGTRHRDLRAGSAAALLASLLGAFLATVLYARVGVDDLSETYVAHYFYAVPALAFAGAAICLAAFLVVPARVAAMLVALSATVWFGQARLRQPLPKESYFDVKYMPELYRKVTSLGPHLALDLDSSAEADRWSKVWSNIAGLQAYASRLGQKPFCIANHWHIVFSPGYRCTEQDLAVDRRLLVMADVPVPPGFRTVLEEHDLTFVEDGEPEGDLGRVLRVADNRPIFGAGILGTGWAGIEAASVWSDGDRATLHLRAPAGARRFKLDLDAFTPNGHVQNVFVTVDGGPERQIVFDGHRGRRWEAFDLPRDAGRDAQVALRVADPISPKQAGVSPDERRLGVVLFAVAFE